MGISVTASVLIMKYHAAPVRLGEPLHFVSQGIWLRHHQTLAHLHFADAVPRAAAPGSGTAFVGAAFGVARSL
jgi:hypothetical protein